MRLLAVVLVLLIAAIQTPLWFGKGGWLRVFELRQEVQSAQTHNEQLRQRNAANSFFLERLNRALAAARSFKAQVEKEIGDSIEGIVACQD